MTEHNKLACYVSGTKIVLYSFSYSYFIILLASSLDYVFFNLRVRCKLMPVLCRMSFYFSVSLYMARGKGLILHRTPSVEQVVQRAATT